MDNNKKFELNDDALDNVAGGVGMDTILSMGTKVTATKVTCPLCGTGHGILGTLFGTTGILCCGTAHQAQYEQNQFAPDCLLVQSPTEEDYILGWN